LGSTVVVVTHELASIFTIGNNSVFLDAKPGDECQRDPKELLGIRRPSVHRSSTRGKENNMSKNLSPTLIGAFVVGPGVMIVAVIALARGSYFAKRKIRPLLRRFGQRLWHRGAVKIKGVEIGSVKDIRWKRAGQQVKVRSY